jgi:hypothetical protein
MTQPMVGMPAAQLMMGAPMTAETAQHAQQTVQGLVTISQMRMAQAQKNVDSLEGALEALNIWAGQLIAMRDAYLQQQEYDRALIEQYTHFADGQTVPAMAAEIAKQRQAMQGQAQTLVAHQPAQQLAAPAPGPGQTTVQQVVQPPHAQQVVMVQGSLTKQPVDMTPDAEGRKPLLVSQITPEMQEQMATAWKQNQVQVRLAAPGDPDYVSPTMAVTPSAPVLDGTLEEPKHDPEHS